MGAHKYGETNVPRGQVEKELSTIIKSELFAGGSGRKKAERLAQLLQHIVTETLNKGEVTENDLLLDFYKLSNEEMKVDNPIARTSVHRLRHKLEEYFATDGLNDPVLVEIEIGQYAASFMLNPKSEALKEVRRGFHHVNRESPADILHAIEHFNKAIKLEPEFAEGYAGKASALLTMTLHAYTDDPRELFEQAEQAALKATELNKNSWQGHANLGAVYLFRHEWEKADAEFDEARRIAPLEIDTIGGYGPYLLSRGHYKQGLELANRYLDEGADDKVLLGRAALYFYALRHFDEAEEVLVEAVRQEPHFWRSHMLLAFVFLATKNPEKALSHMLKVQPLSDMNLWPGLKILCLESAGRSVEAETKFKELLESNREHYVQPMQVGLGHMALGNAAEAISFLSMACDESDPFTGWLHLWPFLDPLRKFPEFRALLRKWRFPAA